MESRTVQFVEPFQNYDSAPSLVSIKVEPDLSELTQMATEYALPERSESYAGVIKKLSLVNFMSVANLSLSFNRKVNFIVSKVGNITSSIQTAIHEVFCTDTKGPSKQLIKAGCQSCSIELVLSNVGPRAYQPFLFGDEITLYRKITPNSNSVHVKNQSGAIILSSDEDLMNLRSFLHIETWNPVSIMSEETVSAFFSLNSKKKYEIFAQATMIDEIQELSRFQSVNYAQLADEMARGQQERQDLLLEIENLSEKRASLERTHNFLIKREALEADYLTWAKKADDAASVAEHELSLRNLNAQAEDVENSILQNSKVEFELRKKVSEIRNSNAKQQKCLFKYNNLRTKFGFDEQALNSLDSVTREWNDPDANHLIDIKSAQVQLEFLTVLRTRKVKARLIIDHNRREIRMMARPLNSSSTPRISDGVLHGETDISTVNPDERAYFNIAFIMALWKISDSPFLSIDGFDQLLSPINKHFIIELFLSTAQEKSKCQFILFSPEMPPLAKPSEGLKIIDLNSLKTENNNHSSIRNKTRFSNGNCTISLPRMAVLPHSINSAAVVPAPPPSPIFRSESSSSVREVTYLSDNEAKQSILGEHPALPGLVVRNLIPLQGQHLLSTLSNKEKRAMRQQHFKKLREESMISLKESQLAIRGNRRGRNAKRRNQRRASAFVAKKQAARLQQRQS